MIITYEQGANLIPISEMKKSQTLGQARQLVKRPGLAPKVRVLGLGKASMTRVRQRGISCLVRMGRGGPTGAEDVGRLTPRV